jgi:two-component system sensor histidine kinase/response regulator
MQGKNEVYNQIAKLNEKLNHDLSANKILVVDDHQQNLEIVFQHLAPIGYKISLALSAKEALHQLHQDQFDLILLDVMMPEMDGFDLCNILRTELKLTTPIIFLTAKTEMASVYRAFELGAQDFITKPFDSSELLFRIKNQLELLNSQRKLSILNETLEQRVQERTRIIEEKNRELQQANENLQHLDDVKNEFILHINHELRTPLQGIKGYAALLNEYIDTQEQRDMLNGLNSSADRLVRLSEMTLLFAELRSSSYELQVEEVKVESLFQQVIEKYQKNSKNLHG